MLLNGKRLNIFLCVFFLSNRSPPTISIQTKNSSNSYILTVFRHRMFPIEIEFYAQRDGASSVQLSQGFRCVQGVTTGRTLEGVKATVRSQQHALASLVWAEVWLRGGRVRGFLCSHEEQQQRFEVDTGSYWEPREEIGHRRGAAWRNVSQNWLQGPSQERSYSSAALIVSHLSANWRLGGGFRIKMKCWRRDMLTCGFECIFRWCCTCSTGHGFITKRFIREAHGLCPPLLNYCKSLRSEITLPAGTSK